MEHTDYSTSHLVVVTDGPTVFTTRANFALRPVPEPAVSCDDRIWAAGNGATRSVCVKSIAYANWDGAHIRLEEGRPVAYEPDVDGILVRAVEQPVRVQVKRRRGADSTLAFVVGYRYRGEIRWVSTWGGNLEIHERPPACQPKPSLTEVARLMSEHLASVRDVSKPSAPSRDRRR